MLRKAGFDPSLAYADDLLAIVRDRLAELEEPMV
jgi:hypothetical protein